jgi:hypothetical protein
MSRIAIVLGLLVLALLIPAVAVQVRRFHDQTAAAGSSCWGSVPMSAPCRAGVHVPAGHGGAKLLRRDPKDADLGKVFA